MDAPVMIQRLSGLGMGGWGWGLGMGWGWGWPYGPGNFPWDHRGVVPAIAGFSTMAKESDGEISEQ